MPAQVRARPRPARGTRDANESSATPEETSHREAVAASVRAFLSDAVLSCMHTLYSYVVDPDIALASTKGRVASRRTAGDLS